MMRCQQCSNEIPDDSKFCPSCGKQPQIVMPPSPPTQVSHSSQPVMRSSLPLGGVLIRCGAAFIDVVLLYILGFIMAVVFGQTTADGFNLVGYAGVLWWLITLTYYIAFESKFGATPAKMLLGLRVIKADSGACDTKAAVIRTVSRLVDNFFLLGVALMLFSKQNQRIGDRLADTLVVKTRAIKLSQIKNNQINNFDD